MPKLIRLYIDSLLVGLVLAILLLCALAVTNIGGVRMMVLSAADGRSAMTSILVFAAGLFSSVLFAIAVVRQELAEDRAAERRRRNGWGRSPRDHRRNRRD